MRQFVWVTLLVSGVLLVFMGYCAALIDWVTDVRTGVYAQHHGEALWETLALFSYTGLGIRFVKRRIDLF